MQFRLEHLCKNRKNCIDEDKDIKALLFLVTHVQSFVLDI